MLPIHWRIQLLGGLRVEGPDRALTRFRTRKTGVVLAYLACHRLPTSREILAEEIWPTLGPDLPDAGGVGDGDHVLEKRRNSLAVALCSLRKQLEPPGAAPGSVLVTDGPNVRLNPSSVSTDVAEFERTTDAAAHSRNASETTRLLSAAVDLYTGQFLPGYYEPWITCEQQRLEEMFFRNLRVLMGRLVRVGDFDLALTYGARGVAVNPLREEAQCDLMRAYYAAGQYDAVLRQYAFLKELLTQRDESPSLDAEVLRRESEKQSRQQTASQILTLGARSERDDDHALPIPSAISDQSGPPFGTVTFLAADLTEVDAAKLDKDGGPPSTPPSGCEGLEDLILRHRGFVLQDSGLTVAGAFDSAGDALDCAIAMQGNAVFRGRPTPSLRVALHTADVGCGLSPSSRSDDASAWQAAADARRTATEAMLASHGGQLLCTETCAALVSDHVGPDSRLSDLGLYQLSDQTPLARLFLVDYPGAQKHDNPPLRAIRAHAGNLPSQLSRFFGREGEITEISALLVEMLHASRRRAGAADMQPFPLTDISPSRLLTLTGPGGIGKSRLALELARGVMERDAAATWFVPCDEVVDPGSILPALAGSMRLAASPDVDLLDQVVETLARQHSLLLLDGFDRLVDGGDGVVEDLLERVPTLVCLVTSRQRLGVGGEQVRSVRPLPLPMDPPESRPSPDQLVRFPSVQIFLERAQCCMPDFTLTLSNATVVSQLCAWLEGIPLALELAAAWIPVQTPSQILERLRSRLDLKKRSSRRRGRTAKGQDGGTAEAGRQSTLRKTIEWSYDLLAPDLQDFFARLSVFRGGWSLDAAEAICQTAGPSPDDSVLDQLSQLQDCSIVISGEVAGEMRFSMLETLQEYAREQLLEFGSAAKEVRDRHAAYFAARARCAFLDLRTAREMASLNRMDAESRNLRAAMEWANQSQQSELVGEIGLGVSLLLQRRGFHRDALAPLEAAAAAARSLPARGTELRTRIVREMSGIACELGEWGKVRSCAEEALEGARALGDAIGEAAAHNLLGLASQGERQMTEARSHFTRAMDLYRSGPDHAGMAIALNNLGLVELAEADSRFTHAAKHLDQALSLRRSLGDRRGTAETLLNLGVLAQLRGEWGFAWQQYEEALQIERDLGYLLGVGRALCNLGEVADAQGHLSRALRLVVGARKLFEGVASPHRIYTTELQERMMTQPGGSSIAAAIESDCPRLLDDMAAWAIVDSEVIWES